MAATDDAALFRLEVVASEPGRVRTGLDLDVARADEAGTKLQAAGVAALQVLADQLDALDRELSPPRRPKPYDRVPIVQVQAQFDATYDRVFAGVTAAADPFATALEEFRRAEAGNASRSLPAD